MTVNASAVSRHLREGGLLPVPASVRDGVSVSRSGPDRVKVVASVVDSTRQELELINAAREILGAKGYKFTTSPSSPNILYVFNEGATS